LVGLVKISLNKKIIQLKRNASVQSDDPNPPRKVLSLQTAGPFAQDDQAGDAECKQATPRWQRHGRHKGPRDTYASTESVGLSLTRGYRPECLTCAAVTIL
jgi:hypothetical protein